MNGSNTLEGGGYQPKSEKPFDPATAKLPCGGSAIELLREKQAILRLQVLVMRLRDQLWYLYRDGYFFRMPNKAPRRRWDEQTEKMISDAIGED